MKTIAIANRKGGVEKSTTASALGACFQKKGYKVLTIDLDAQRNLSTTLKAKTDAKTVLGVITGEITAKEAIQHTENGDVIAASKGLSGANLIVSETGKEYRLKEAFESVSDVYDFCVIDCPPALNILTINALVAADGVLIPAQADLYSLEGIKDLSEVMQPVIKYCNANLKIYGILLTRYSSRSVLSKDATTLAKRLAEQLKTIVFTTTIREAVAVKEAQISQKSSFDYAPNANVTMDYKIFIDEFLQRI